MGMQIRSELHNMWQVNTQPHISYLQLKHFQGFKPKWKQRQREISCVFWPQFEVLFLDFILDITQMLPKKQADETIDI